MANKRLAGVVARHPGTHRGTPTGRVLLSPETADVFRAVAKYLGMTLDELAQAMLADYLPRHAPGLDLVWQDATVPGEPPAELAAVHGAHSIFGNPAIPEKRKAERRKTSGLKTQPEADRRKTIRRKPKK